MQLIIVSVPFAERVVGSTNKQQRVMVNDAVQWRKRLVDLRCNINLRRRRPANVVGVRIQNKWPRRNDRQPRIKAKTIVSNVRRRSRGYLKCDFEGG